MIKNYTSTVSSLKSIAHIEQKLVENGARNIIKMYDEKQEIEAICFSIMIDNNLVGFKLPAKVSDAYELFRSLRTRYMTDAQKRTLKEQAERTAWKLVSDWVDIQMAMIELKQAEFAEIFLPYIYYGKDQPSFFEQIKGSGFRLLPAPSLRGEA